MINEDVTEIKKRNYGSLFEKLSYYAFLALVFFLPVFFMPNASLPLGKGLIFTVLVLISFIFLILVKLKEGYISYPMHLISLSAIIIVAVFFLSAVFSGSISSSILGSGFEVGTFVSILLSFILLFLATQLLNSKNRIFSFYLAFFAAFFLLALFQIARLVFGADFMSFGEYVSTGFNLIGKWNDLGIFFGLIAIISLITIEAFAENRIFKIIGIMMLAISLFFLAVVNYSSVWITLGLFALLSTIYLFTFRKKTNENDLAGEIEKSTAPAFNGRLSFSSILVLIISLVFIASSIATKENPEKDLGVRISNFFNISQI